MEKREVMHLTKTDYLTGLKELNIAVLEFVGGALELQHNENFIRVATELPIGSSKKITIDNGRDTSSIRVYRKNIGDDSPLVFEETLRKTEGQGPDEILSTCCFVDPDNVATSFRIVSYPNDGVADGRTDFDGESIPAIPDLGKIGKEIQLLALAEIHLGYIQKMANLAAAKPSNQT